MSWKSGVPLVYEILRAVAKRFPQDHASRQALYLDLIPAFERRDCDNLMDCKGIDPAFDKAYDQLNPPENET
jgi:hypothetical protein